MQVYKYPLKPGLNLFHLPRGAKILSAHAQRNAPTMWALVPKDETIILEHKVFCAMTGEDLPETFFYWKFIGTVLLSDDCFVFHVFQEVA